MIDHKLRSCCMWYSGRIKKMFFPDELLVVSLHVLYGSVLSVCKRVISLGFWYCWKLFDSSLSCSCRNDVLITGER